MFSAQVRGHGELSEQSNGKSGFSQFSSERVGPVEGPGEEFQVAGGINLPGVVRGAEVLLGLLGQGGQVLSVDAGCLQLRNVQSVDEGLDFSDGQTSGLDRREV